GTSAIEFVSRFSVTHAIISTGAVDAAQGVMDYELEEAEFARMVLSRGQRRMIVTDCTKFGRRGLVHVCDFDGFDELFTDGQPPREIVEAVEKGGVRLAIAGAE